MRTGPPTTRWAALLGDLHFWIPLGAFGVGDACEVDLGLWADLLGNYVLLGTCPGNGETVTLVVVDGILHLRGLPENEDIPLVCEDDVALGEGVTAFGVSGHELTITIQDAFLSLALFQPETLGSCESVMAP